MWNCFNATESNVGLSTRKVCIYGDKSDLDTFETDQRMFSTVFQQHRLQIGKVMVICQPPHTLQTKHEPRRAKLATKHAES